VDSTDKKILEILKEDSRTPYTDIAEDLDVSEGTIRNRIKKLEENEVIEKYTVRVDKKEQIAIVMAKVSTDTDFSSLFSELPEDIELFEVAGSYDIIIKFSRDSNEEINKVIDSIRLLDNIEETNTYSVLKNRSK